MRGKKKKRGRHGQDQRTTGWAATAGRIQATPVNLEEMIKTYAPLVPGRVGSDLSFIEFADEVEPSTLLNLTKSLWLRPSTCVG